MDREIRGGIPAEIRTADDGVTVAGYAAVYGERANISDMFIEVIQAGAFEGILQRSDVSFLVNHRGEPLARTTSGTLLLEADEKGLRVETKLDISDPDVMRIIPKMQRGDMDKMSFAFFMDGGKQEWDDTGELPVRTIEKFGSIDDVSIVTHPAYVGTEIGLRSLEKHRDQLERTNNFNAVSLRRRMKKDLAKRTT
ncbi:HK97 family phage prohead protease [Lentilitoribacter sp. EG35]|uniref:HK97 family phage prohead protease n=1 Tax=Lentilitoribacter sp. EG35 TaxID=3234192 RepID=UPI0034613884